MKPKFRLFVGGMGECTKESALWMAYTDEERFDVFPTWPKVLYAIRVPIIWFWGELYTEPEPTLPSAFNPEYFTIFFDYTMDEYTAIVDAFKPKMTEVTSRPIGPPYFN